MHLAGSWNLTGAHFADDDADGSQQVKRPLSSDSDLVAFNAFKPVSFCTAANAAYVMLDHLHDALFTHDIMEACAAEHFLRMTKKAQTCLFLQGLWQK